MSRSFGGRTTTCESSVSIDVRRWHRERKLNAGLSFSCSWTYGGEAAGRIGVRTAVDAVVLMYRGRGWGISNGSPSSNVGQLLGPHATSAHSFE